MFHDDTGERTDDTSKYKLRRRFRLLLGTSLLKVHPRVKVYLFNNRANNLRQIRDRLMNEKSLYLIAAAKCPDTMRLTQF